MGGGIPQERDVFHLRGFLADGCVKKYIYKENQMLSYCVEKH